MELYLRFNPEDEFPQKVRGLIIWPELGNAATEIEGIVDSRHRLSFKEIACKSGDCSKVVLGGEYFSDYIFGQSKMSGAAQGKMGLKGKFDLSLENGPSP